ncbi:unnamed protein product [Meganyctiphanes norvegica]|uniref:Vitellogenin domain-containing protein n=1 Tax=Meganyctiphanes norvegica TaxID=48144 RepID=A0AAV2QBC9_MEGNR
MPDTTGHEFIQSSLIFNKKGNIDSKVQIEIVENILKKIEMATQDTISSEVPMLFSSLVKALRGLDYKQLSSVYRNAKVSHSIKYLIDAIPLVQTAAAMEILKEMMNNFDINIKEADVFFTSLAFINHPSSDMFSVLAPLLENNPMPKLMLGVSALVNNYCKMNSNCISESGVQNVVQNIEFQLGSACRTTKEEEKNAVLVALKALGNSGHMINSESILQRCYTEENDMEIRVAAIEAWRHTSCDYDRSHLLAAFQDENQDTEIRIAAYLAAMTCPTSEIIDVINSHLISEGVNQVTSFVWTHITNIQESAAPGKQFIQEFISEELLQNKFKNEALKFSRNFETSLFRGDLNVGTAIESNVIFSSKSILPRSAMLNLTFDLFGESINFFEVGGRINGFESVIEHFFGPKGYYPDETVQTIISTLRKQQNNGEDSFEGLAEKKTDEPEGSYYLRMFGNEVSYDRFHGFKDLIKPDLLSNPFSLLMELVNNGHIDYTKSYQIIDNELMFPTATGLPLKLKLDGTATLVLKSSGNFNVRSLDNVNIEGKIYPSAAVMIDSSMSVDTPLIQSGMKMVSTLHTSTYLEGKLRIDGAKIVDMALNIPKDKMEIINFDTEFFQMEDDDLIKEDPVNTIVDNTCTQDTLGIAICKEITYITPDHQSSEVCLSDLVTAKLYIKKLDTHTGYLLQYIHEANQIYFMFDTPASKESRNIAFSLQFMENQLIYDLVTPIKSIKGEAEIEWEAMNKRLMINNIIDGKPYNLQGEIYTTVNNQLHTEFKITSNEEVIFDTSITGHFAIDKYFNSELDIKYSFMNNIKNSIKHSSFFSKEASSDMSKYILHSELKSSQFSNLNLELDWQIDMTSQHFDNQLTVQYGPTVSSVKILYEANEKYGELFRNIKFELNSGEHRYYQAVNLNYESAANLSGMMQFDILIKDFIDISHSASIETKKLEKEHYTLQMTQQMKTKSTVKDIVIGGSFIDKSSPGTIKIDILGLFKDDQNEIKYRSTISANNDIAGADFNLEHNDSIYFATVQGTQTSIILESNILQHILLNAEITPSGETRAFNLLAEWNKDVDPTAVLLINGEFSKNLIKAGFKYSMSEAFILVKRVDTGLELEASWSPDEKVVAKVIYSLDNVKSLTIIVNTPFKGYETQMLDIMFSLLKYNVKASFSATWRKSNFFLFTLDTKVQHGLHSNMIKSKINFTSTFENFALLSLSLDHEMDSSSVLTDVNGKWNGQEMNGRIEFKAFETAAEFSAAFISPFTKDVKIDMKCNLDHQNLSLILKGQYGLLNSNISIKGYKSNNNNLTIILTVDTPYQSIPKIFSNINYRFDGIKNEFVVDSTIDDKKYMILINVSKEITDLSLNITGDLRLITPFSHPITITYYYKQDDKTFISNFETTRFWSTNGSFKGNIEGKIISGNDMHFSIKMASQDFDFVSEMNHSFQNKHLNSNLALTINEERIALEAKGIINENYGIAKIHIGMVSTNQELDDVKLEIDHSNDEIRQLSKISLQKGIRKVQLLHRLSFIDFYNFDNTLEINDWYKLNNKQSFDDAKFSHEVKYDWGPKTIQGNLMLGHQIDEKNRDLDFYLFLKTPWTFNKIIQTHYEDNGKNYKSITVFEYEPKKKIELSNVCICDPNFCSLKSSLTTPFWKPMHIEFNYKFTPENDVTITLEHGNTSTKIQVSGTIQSGYLDVQANLQASYIKLPLKVRAHYNLNGIEKFAQFGIKTDKWYGIQGQYYASDFKNFKGTVTAELPFQGAENLEISTEYFITNRPYKVHIVLKRNDDIYKIDGMLSEKEFKVDFIMNENTAVFHSSWRIETFTGKLDIEFISPISSVDSINTSIIYNLNEKNMSIKLKKGTKEISMTGRMEGQNITIEGVTSFIGWEVLNASIIVADTEFDITASKNEEKFINNWEKSY